MSVSNKCPIYDRDGHVHMQQLASVLRGRGGGVVSTVTSPHKVMFLSCSARVCADRLWASSTKSLTLNHPGKQIPKG